MPLKRHQYILLFLGSLLLLFLSACSGKKEQEQFTIAFSQCVESDLWRKTMLEEMKRELSFHRNITFLYKQADGNSQKQIQQVKEFLQKDIDLLIISPNEADPLTPVVEETYKKGIPVIVVDRKISTSLYSAYVGGDNYEVGKMAGQYAAQLLNGKGNVIEVTGLPKSSPAIERHKGFVEALEKYPSINIVRKVNGEWLKEKAQSKLTAIPGQYSDINLFFAHNDRMALGTYEVLKTKEMTMKPMIIGVDGLPGKDAGLDLVAGKVLTATMLYPTGGEEAIRTAIKILNKEPFAKENLLQTTVIDSSNVRIMQLQAAKVASQQQQIERQQTLMTEQVRIYNNQRTLLYIMVLSLVLAIILGGLAFFSLRENQKINKQLLMQNLEISDQKAQLEIMSAKAQAANEAKVNFFTNISHEFRTPLTLILGPLEELLANSKNSYNTNQSLSLIQKNVMRLLRLINQLMDFRKIEADKMKLRACEIDLVAFISDIIQSYKTIAHKKAIDLRLITNERQLNVWIDVTMIDKVIFNLLSNAFKFTKDEGFIHVHITKEGTEAIIKVEDNGVGMSPNALEHAFEVFYQGDYENYKGSGLGLALSKELIQLHKGTISIKSEKWKGTTFEIRLPLGNAHLAKEEMIEEEENNQASLYEQEKIYTSDLQTIPVANKELEESKTGKEQSILIIEDNADLRGFLARKFNNEYDIVEADNGQSALQQAFDTIPDLIICDVVIPGKDGMALTSILKNDIRTSHIPIILLTAKSSIEQQIEGMKNKADAYITKPFNVQFLEQSVKSLLTNRTRLKEHFTGELSSNLKTQTVGKLDRKFINEFTTLVESNIANEDFNVDEICKSMGISRVQLYRKVKALLNINVNDYILNTRLQKAKYLLQHEEATVSEIAYKVGFSSPAYFSTVFKSKFGVTPKAFKEK